MPIFKIPHPNYITPYICDNSQNHHDLALDALRASALNIKDDEYNVKHHRDGWFG